jgi:hypothetical protein
MQAAEIREFVEYQKNHWKQCDGHITSYDIKEGILKANGKEFTVNKNAEEQILQRLKLVGTAGDFAKLNKKGEMEDAYFMQQAIARKIAFGQKTASRIIYDEDTNQAKAVKSTRYNRIYNLDVLDKAMEKYQDFFTPNLSHVDDDYMYLSFDKMSEIVIKDDRFSTGIQAWNSETGNASLGVGQLMFRFACTNGMVGKDSIDVERMAHSENDLMMRFLNAIDKVKDTTNFQKTIEKSINNPNGLVRRIYDLGLDIPETDRDHPRHSWTNMLARFKFPEKYVNGIIAAHLKEPVGIVDGGVNAWGLYNAITRYATHDYPLDPEFNAVKQQAMFGSAYPLLNA